MILNLTQHAPTPEQVAEGVGQPLAGAKELLTFVGIPAPAVIQERARQLVALVKEVAPSAPALLAEYAGAMKFCPSLEQEPEDDNPTEMGLYPSVRDCWGDPYTVCQDRNGDLWACGYEDADPDPRLVWTLIPGAKKVMEGVPAVSPRVMIGGAPYLMAPLERMLKKSGYRPVYSFSERRSVEETLPDGSVKKTAVFAHVGWVEV